MPSSNQFIGFVQDVIGQYRHSRSTVTSHVIHLRSSLLDKFCTNFVAQGFVVFIIKVYAFCHCYAVVRYGWSAEGFANNYIATLWSHSSLYGVIQNFCASKHSLTSIVIIKYFLTHFVPPFIPLTIYYLPFTLRLPFSIYFVMVAG